jgi:membrane protein DedA with SNARE-associated domain
MLHYLIGFGGAGLFIVAVIDSSVIPVPLPGSADLVLLLLTAYRSSSSTSTLTFVACAFSGSVIGGFLTWAAGRKGGEAAIERLGKGRFVRQVSNWVKRNGMVSVGVAALLPPPVPLLPFLLAAGALGVSRARFVVPYSAARLIRYGVLGWLGHTYGKRVVFLWQEKVKGWSVPIISVYVVLLLSCASYGLWKYSRERHAARLAKSH